MATKTANFGAGRRESHDASAFYARFTAPELSSDETVNPPAPIEEPCIQGDSRKMEEVADSSVALVVTSPPYFAGKEYEEALGQGGVPESYIEFLELLREVFSECKRKLEPGGRIAVNVANLGRKPYRSLSADVIHILQDDLGMLLRGEIVWQKGEGASGSCAWGSFRRATNPVLRDLTERVVVASKGRFDRARSIARRAAAGMPHESTSSTDEFLEATLDLWTVAPESARRVQHPAPFPVELPRRLIELYTYKGDLVLDPFLGSGSTVVAALQAGRLAVGYDLDASYVARARERVRDEVGSPGEVGSVDSPGDGVSAVAEAALVDAGFTVEARNHRPRGLGVTVAFSVTDRSGERWLVDVSGAYTSSAARGGVGLARTDVALRALGRATVLSTRGVTRVLLVTSHLPRRRTEADLALRAAGPRTFFDAIELGSPAAMDRLRAYASGVQGSGEPLPGFWTPTDLT